MRTRVSPRSPLFPPPSRPGVLNSASQNSQKAISIAPDRLLPARFDNLSAQRHNHANRLMVSKPVWASVHRGFESPPLRSRKTLARRPRRGKITTTPTSSPRRDGRGRTRLFAAAPDCAYPCHVSDGRDRSLGEFIRRQRELSEVSMRQFAELVGISNPYLSQIERGLRAPSERGVAIDRRCASGVGGHALRRGGCAT